MRLVTIDRIRLAGFSAGETEGPRLWGDCFFDDGFVGLFNYDPQGQTVQVKQRVADRRGDYSYELCHDAERINQVAEMAPLHWDRAVSEAAEARRHNDAWNKEREAHARKLDAGAATYEALLVVLAQGLTPQARIKAEAAIAQAEGEGARSFTISAVNAPHIRHSVTTTDPFDALRTFMFRQPLRSSADHWNVTPG